MATTGCNPSVTSKDHHQGGGGEPWLPPGFRFHPTDEELVTYYLTKKVVDSSFRVHAIAEVDLNKCEPWDLPGKPLLLNLNLFLSFLATRGVLMA